MRIIAAPFDGRDTAIFMRAIDPTADNALAVDYSSPVMTRRYDRVEVAPDIHATSRVRAGQVFVEVAIPFSRLGFQPRPGLRLAADFGFIASDASGTQNAARVYWSNKDTNLTSDLPSEAWMQPAAWGEIVFE